MIKMEEPYASTILLTETEEYTLNVYLNDEVIDGAEFDVEVELENIDEEEWNKYFIFTKTDVNKFTIKNLKTYSNGYLKIKATWNNSPGGLFEVESNYTFELGSFY